jgi:DNA-binding response OmpR family regulator
VAEHPCRILLVEDDEAFADAVTRHLRARGLEVRRAASAEEAREILGHEAPPAVVILDINLPGDTGWSLLRNPELAAAGSPPVVIASVTAIHPRKLREYGVAGYLPKPFPLEALVRTIDRLVNEGSPAEEP